MRRARTSTTLALSLSLGLCATGARAQYTPRIAEGHAALEAGDTARARAVFTGALDGGDPSEASLAGYFLAQVADAELDFATALEGYRAFVARDPGSRYAGRATARVEDLAAHAEGGFAPLRALERVRRSTTLSNDLTALRALGREAEGWPAGPTRVEARLLVAEAMAGRLHREREAVALLRAVVRDPASTQDQRDLAAGKLVTARALLGEQSDVEDDLARATIDEGVRADARTLARRARLSQGAKVLLGALALVGAVVLQAAWRRGQMREVMRAWRRPLPLAQIAMLSLGGAALAKMSDGHEGGPVYALGIGALGVYLVASAWGVVGAERASARAFRAACCMVGVLAVSFLVMEALDPMMLDGVSL
ncbi:MAG: hypothetical protein R3A52_29095 [Polyangiales bacterium]